MCRAAAQAGERLKGSGENGERARAALRIGRRARQQSELRASGFLGGELLRDKPFDAVDGRRVSFFTLP